MTKETAQSKFNHEVNFQVAGIHCASCALIIERKLLELPDIHSALANGNEVSITYLRKQPSPHELNALFAEEGYKFFLKTGDSVVKNEPVNWLIVTFSLILSGLLYLLIEKLGLVSLFKVDASSSLPSFIIFGFLAGVSTCAALLGGIVLTLSKSWSDREQSKPYRPHLYFNLGRLLSFSILGAILGGVGAAIRPSPLFTAIIIFAVSIIMLLVAAQMLGIYFNFKIGIRSPKFITRYIISNKSWTPFLIGIFTLLLPCGFTLTAQSLALVSGSAVQGMLIMLSFATGTFLPLLLIGIGSTRLYENKSRSLTFSRIAGILLLIYTIFNVRAGLNLIDFKTNNSPQANVSSDDTAETQVIRMEANAQGYSPNYFKVKAGAPVRWEIYDSGTSGCTNAVISRNLFSDEIRLEKGKTAIKVFTPQKSGKYRFSCWMGMVSGVIEVTQ